MGKTLSRLMGFNPSYFDFYIHGEELLDIFCAYDNEKCGDFEKIITDSERWSQEQIKDYNDIVTKVEKNILREDKRPHSFASIEKSEQYLFNFSSTEVGAGVNTFFSDQEQYILDDIYRQKIIISEPVKLVQDFGKNLQKMIRANHKQMRFNTIEEGLLLLYKASVENKIVLKEQIWTKLDEITDLKILQNLIVLTFINNMPDDLCQFRIFILERPDLWSELSGSD